MHACVHYTLYVRGSHRHMPEAKVAVRVHIEALAASIDGLHVPCSDGQRWRQLSMQFAITLC